MQEPPEFDPRAPMPGGDYARALELPKKSLREWLREPSSWVVMAAVGGFFAVVWGFCFLTALMLTSSAGGQGLFGVQTTVGLIAMASVLFAFLLTVWGILTMGPRLLWSEDGLVDRVVAGLFGKHAAPPELDESPALLARKRGDAAGAVRLYRQWVAEFPHRTELYFFIAEIEHKDLGNREAGLLGYRDFVRRVEHLERAPTPRELEYVPLAQAYITDLERPPEPRRPRVIKV